MFVMHQLCLELGQSMGRALMILKIAVLVRPERSWKSGEEGTGISGEIFVRVSGLGPISVRL